MNQDMRRRIEALLKLGDLREALYPHFTDEEVSAILICVAKGLGLSAWTEER